MRERPILFSGSMVRAILAGQKTVTRRVINVPAGVDVGDVPGHPEELMLFGVGREHVGTHTRSKLVTCPYGDPGDRLWVKETWLPHEFDDHADIATYRADYNDGPIPKAILDEREGRSRWHSGRFMPRCASRITLEVASVRVERLHALDDADALREGVMATVGHEALGRERLPGWPRQLFSVLWDEINGKRAAWVSNPWVWRIEFKVSGVVRRG